MEPAEVMQATNLDAFGDAVNARAGMRPRHLP
jgi:hypothetical protein